LQNESLDNQLKHLYQSERIALLYKNAPLGFMISLLIAPLMGIMLWDHIPQFQLLSWLGAIALITLLRFVLHHQYHQKLPGVNDARAWGHYFLATTFLAGLCWGYAGLLVSPANDIQHWLLVLFVLTGFTGGALALFSPSQVAYCLFVIPLLSPLAINLMLASDDHGISMGLLILLFLTLTTILSHRTQKFTDNSIKIRFENTGLLNELETFNTNLLTTQKELRKTYTLLENAFNATQVLYAHMDKDFNFIQVNKAYADAGGFNTRYFMGKNHFSLYPNDENQAIFQQVVETSQAYSVNAKAFINPDHAEAGVTYWDWTLQPITNADDVVEELLLTLVNVTRAHQDQIALEEKEQYLRTVMNTAADAIITMDILGTIELCNSAVKTIFGYTTEELIGKNIKLIVPDTPHYNHTNFISQRLASNSENTGNLQLETIGLRHDNSEFPLEISISETHIGSKIIFICIMHDISSYKSLIDTLNQKNNELEHLSSHDALTNLYNRRYADHYLQREHKRACRNNSNISVILIDIDYFKKFNDHYGHQAGDECLRETSNVMKKCLKRPSDIIARYGGEEFLVILPETPIDGAIQVAHELLEAVRGANIAHAVSSASDVVTISAGISVLIPEIDCSYEKLIATADQALYIAKENGRNQFYHKDIIVTEKSI